MKTIIANTAISNMSCKYPYAYVKSTKKFSILLQKPNLLYLILSTSGRASSTVHDLNGPWLPLVTL